jgi:predicted ATP-dependent endonuclease of OLD family
MSSTDFRLIKLELFNHPYFNDISIDFTNEFETNLTNNNQIAFPYITLLIGPNGTGKSQILNEISLVFRELEDLKNKEKLDDLNHKRKKSSNSRINYIINYQIGKDKYIVEKKGESLSRFFCRKNSDVITIFDLKLPEKLIASSFTLNDKFPFDNLDNFEINENRKSIYRYLGIRNKSGTVGTRSPIKNLVGDIITASQNPKFTEHIELLLDFLDLDPYFKIRFKTRYRSKFYENDLTVDDFKSFFVNWSKTRPGRTTEPYSISYFNKLSEKEINHLVSFINDRKSGIVNKRTRNYFELDPLYMNYNLEDQYMSEYKSIFSLMKLDLLSYPTIEIKKNKTFDLESSSSGEYHFIYNILRILANIQDNSLILIDEPEISLHPNWQIKYIDYLKRIFSSYSSCHFMLATHSHFMVSDLQNENSSIVTFKRNAQKDIEAQTPKLNTYGWSAEEVLYDVFELPTTRNYYLANEVGDILSLVSEKEKNIQEITKRVNHLKKFHLELNDIDPLKEIIGSLIERFG